MRDREGVRRGVRRRARGSARQSTSTKSRGGCTQVAESSQEQEAVSAVAGRRMRGKRWARRCIRRDGRGRGTSYAVERLNYRLWYASPNELGYASTNLRAYSTARTARVATIGCFHDQAQPLSLHLPPTKILTVHGLDWVPTFELDDDMLRRLRGTEPRSFEDSGTSGLRATDEGVDVDQ